MCSELKRNICIIGQPENYCIGDLSQSPDIFGVITSILLVIEPNQAIFDIVQEYFGAWIYKGKLWLNFTLS